MKKKLVLIALNFVFCLTIFAQTNNKYLANSGKITFFSDAPLEDITAVNKQVQVILDNLTGDMAFKVVMKNFLFTNAAMQKHFNEKSWLDSQTFPNATFEGKIVDLKLVDFTKEGIYQVSVTGKMTIKGITKAVTQKGTIEVKGTSIILKSEFMVNVNDYGVNIPADNVTKLNKNLKINVDATLNPYVR